MHKDVWKRKIVKYFVLRSVGLSHIIKDERDLFKHFARYFEKNTQIAFEELQTEKIVEKYKINRKMFYGLNIEKRQEIERIIKNEPFGEKADLIRPTKEESKGLKEIFKDTSSREWPNRGFYYFYTKLDEPNYLIVLIKVKPNSKPNKIILGSIKDKKSRIIKIWNATLKVSKTNKGKPFIRRWVENIEQKACGSNRLPSKSAFHIFVYLKWLKIANRKGNVLSYQIINKNGVTQ
ncbi:MAG: hypothetical protein D9C04_06235 [Nitrosopumilus sp. B06]|nr:MAG: hypothetical protein D9C04_06235 [Nitrosopumilus sp. B06]